MTEPFETLRQGFRFDLWANLEWLRFLDHKGIGEPDRNILGHALGAQEIWLKRCYGISLSAVPEIDPTEPAMLELHEGWIAQLTQCEHDPIYDYSNTAGLPFSQPLSQIARHVIDHGTYHRGELRGLCRSRGDTDFPETGLMLYYMTAEHIG